MAEPTYSGRRVVWVVGLIVIVVVALVLVLFFNGPRAYQYYKN